MMGTSRVVALAIAATALVAVWSPNGLGAAETEDSGADAVRLAVTPVLVVNNHVYAVTVYAFDEDGERHKLGRLARSAAETLEIPETLVDGDGNVLLRVFPDSPTPGLGSPTSAMPGVRTLIPVRSEASLIAFWLEPDLAESFTEVIAG